MDTNLRTTTTIAWVALALSALALVISIVSWNDGDVNEMDDDNDTASTTSMGVVTGIKLELARLKAASQLALLQTKDEGTEGYNELEQKVVVIRQNLADAYKDAKQETGSEWRAIEVDFGNLTNDIKNKSVSAMTKLKLLIDRLVTND